MTHIHRLLVFVWLLAAALHGVALAAAEPNVVLFLDDDFIARKEGVVRKVAQAERFLPSPIVSSDEPFRPWQPWLTVLNEPERELPFRMWYNAYTDDGSVTEPAYLESKDGIAWLAPRRVLTDLKPLLFGARVIKPIDERPNRYAMLYFVLGRLIGAPEKTGVYLAHSADGIRWHPVTENPVIRTDVSDIIDVFYNPGRSQYTMLMKLYQSHRWRNAEGVEKNEVIRLVGISQSSDLFKWTEPTILFGPDENDPGVTEWYGTAGIHRRGEYWIGMLKVSRDDINLTKDPEGFGTGYTVLTWSRDGVHWNRDRAPDYFLAPDPAETAWDHSHAWIDSVVRLNDKTYFYYGGYRGGHKANQRTDRQIGLARALPDRYTYVTAEKGEGLIQTRPVTFESGTVSLNADANEGAIDVEILDEQGMPISGFAFADCADVRSNGTSVPVASKGVFEDLKGRKISIVVRLTGNARLYAVNY